MHLRLLLILILLLKRIEFVTPHFTRLSVVKSSASACAISSNIRLFLTLCEKRIRVVCIDPIKDGTNKFINKLNSL